MNLALEFLKLWAGMFYEKFQQLAQNYGGYIQNYPKLQCLLDFYCFCKIPGLAHLVRYLMFLTRNRKQGFQNRPKNLPQAQWVRLRRTPDSRLTPRRRARLRWASSLLLPVLLTLRFDPNVGKCLLKFPVLLVLKH